MPKCIYLFLFIVLQLLCGNELSSQTINPTSEFTQILYETNEGYHDLTDTVTTVFIKYTLPSELLKGDFYGKRRMIIETFMAGINFASSESILTIEQFWNGIKVQQCIIKPKLEGVNFFYANQNRPLDIKTQVKREDGPINQASLRNHSYWQTDFEGTSFFGQGDEYSWGNTKIDLSRDVSIEWKYAWSKPGNYFYFDHLKVVY